jgi:hypothetical protein
MKITTKVEVILPNKTFKTIISEGNVEKEMEFFKNMNEWIKENGEIVELLSTSKDNDYIAIGINREPDKIIELLESRGEIDPELVEYIYRPDVEQVIISLERQEQQNVYIKIFDRNTYPLITLTVDLAEVEDAKTVFHVLDKDKLEKVSDTIIRIKSIEETKKLIERFDIQPECNTTIRFLEDVKQYLQSPDELKIFIEGE